MDSVSDSLVHPSSKCLNWPKHAREKGFYSCDLGSERKLESGHVNSEQGHAYPEPQSHWRKGWLHHGHVSSLLAGWNM